MALTGELTLSGRVLPVGGIQDKLLAARRAGVKTVVIPKANEADLADVPDKVLEDLTVLPIDDVKSITDVVLN